MNKKFKTTFSLIPLDRKIDEKNYPDFCEIDGVKYVDYKIKESILAKSWYTHEVSIIEFVNLLKNGHSFCPAVFQENSSHQKYIPLSLDWDIDMYSGKPESISIQNYNLNFHKKNHIWRSKNNFLQSQSIVVDIDMYFNSLEELLEYIHNSPLKDVNIIYATFSYSENCFKVRLIWFLKEVVIDIREYEEMVTQAIIYFKGDSQCKDGSRMFYSGKEILYVNDDILFDNELFKNLIKKDSNEIITKKVSKENEKSYICKNNIDISNYLKSLGYHYTEDGGICEFDFEYALSESKILQSIQTKECTHGNILTIATNLYWVNGGLKWLKKQMEESNKKGITDYNDNNFEILKSVKRYKYYPQDFKEKDLDYDSGYKNLLELCNANKKYYVQKMETEIKTTTLEKAERVFENTFKHILKKKIEPGKTEIHIFNPPTGLGKTQLLEDVPVEGCIVAFPTHDLKKELNDRMIESNLFAAMEIQSTLEIPNFSDELKEKISYYFSVGLTAKVSGLLYRIIHGKDIGIYYSKEDVTKAKAYKEHNKKLFESKRTILTTHKLAVSDVFKQQQTVIFDEDPFSELFSIKEISGSDLLNLRHIFDITENKIFRNLIQSVIEKLIVAVGSEIVEMPFISNDLRESIVNELINNQTYNSDIYNFLFCDYLCLKIATKKEIEDVAKIGMENAIFKYGIRYTKRKQLPLKKIVIFSATIQKEIYEMAYGKDNVFFHETPFIEPKGQIIQDTRYSCTKSSLEGKHVQKYIKDNCDLSLPTISFKGNDYTNTSMYFFNLRGYDELKGKVINVIGTPELPSWAYIILAKCIGYNIRSLNQEYKDKEVEYNGYKFNFQTFEDKSLTSLQLSLITGELMQAVGRSRPLREEGAVTYIYSRVPLPGAIQKYLKR